MNGKRRDKIGKAYLTKVLPFDRFRIENNRLEFDEVGLNLNPPTRYSIRWFRTRRGSQEQSLNGPPGNVLPITPAELREGELLIAHFYSGDPRTIRVYIRNHKHVAEVVGLERTWGHTEPKPKKTAVTLEAKR